MSFVNNVFKHNEKLANKKPFYKIQPDFLLLISAMQFSK